jgi:uncharacterized protein
MQSASKSQTVAIIGATDKDGRYAKLAQALLIEKGHRVIPINPLNGQVGGIQAYPGLDQVPADITIDTVTLYIRPELLEAHLPAILARKVRRVIFNPGTESPTHQRALETAGITAEAACTLILLRTGQF